MSQKKLLQLSHFVSQQGDFILKDRRDTQSHSIKNFTLEQTACHMKRQTEDRRTQFKYSTWFPHTQMIEGQNSAISVTVVWFKHTRYLSTNTFKVSGTPFLPGTNFLDLFWLMILLLKLQLGYFTLLYLNQYQSENKGWQCLGIDHRDFSQHSTGTYCAYMKKRIIYQQVAVVCVSNLNTNQ